MHCVGKMVVSVVLTLTVLVGGVNTQQFRPQFKGGVRSPESRPRPYRGSGPCHLTDMYAECELQPNHLYFPPHQPSGLTGMVRFSQYVDTRECRMGDLHVDLLVENCPIIGRLQTAEQGVHITSGGDLSRSCYSLGRHFNPHKAPHGAPWFPYYRRHVGDLGNVVRQANGTIRARFTDKLASLYGRDSITGKGFAITERRDDLGLGGEETSLIDGNSGPPVACCVIQLLQ